MPLPDSALTQGSRGLANDARTIPAKPAFLSHFRKLIDGREVAISKAEGHTTYEFREERAEVALTALSLPAKSQARRHRLRAIAHHSRWRAAGPSDGILRRRRGHRAGDDGCTRVSRPGCVFSRPRALAVHYAFQDGHLSFLFLEEIGGSGLVVESTSVHLRGALHTGDILTSGQSRILQSAMDDMLVLNGSASRDPWPHLKRADIMRKPMIVAAAAALTFSVIAEGINAKDILYGLAGRWCSTKWDNKPKEFEITKSGVLFDGVPGEAPACKTKRATNKNEAFVQHFVTWRCDPHPAHEPEERPTPKYRFYEVAERLVPFTIHDTNGGLRFFLLRDTLPLGRRAVRIYEMCKETEHVR
jgi:hypothetical protein